MYKYLKIFIWVFAGLTIATITYFTVQASYTIETPAFLRIDFENKKQLILAYSGLTGTILSFLTIIFLILNIIDQQHKFEIKQDRENTKIENEKLIEKKRIEQNQQNHLIFLSHLIGKVVKNNLEQGDELNRFIQKEEKNPDRSNLLRRLISGNSDRVLSLNISTSIEAFKRFLPKEIAERIVNDIHEIVLFYGKIDEELHAKFTIHIKEKFEAKRKIANDINHLFDKIVYKMDIFKRQSEIAPFDHIWYEFFGDIVKRYNLELIMESEEGETDLNKFAEWIGRNFINPFYQISKKHVYDTEILDFVGTASNLRKRINSIKVESLNYAKNLSSFYDEFYRSESRNIKRLEEIKLKIDAVIVL